MTYFCAGGGHGGLKWGREREREGGTGRRTEAKVLNISNDIFVSEPRPLHVIKRPRSHSWGAGNVGSICSVYLFLNVWA